MVLYAARCMQPNPTSVASMCRIVAYGSDWVKWLLPVIGQERFLKQVDFFLMRWLCDFLETLLKHSS